MMFSEVHESEIAEVAPRRAYFVLRSWNRLLVVLALGCSEGSPTDSTNPRATPINHPPTGGAASTGGVASAGGAISNGATTSTGGTTGADGTGGEAVPVPSTGGAQNPLSPPTLATEVLIEEDELGFCFVDGVLETTNPGFSGTGYANSDITSGARVEWIIQVGETGTHALEFSFANGSGAERPAALSINGEQRSTDVSFSSTADWSTWSTARVDVTLEAGTNRLTLSATTADGLVNIDNLTVRGAAITPLDCTSTVGTGGASGAGGTSGGGGADQGTGGDVLLPDITVYVAGDSTVSTYSDTPSANDQAGWGQMLHEIFDDRVTLQNRASGGRTARWFHLEGAAQWILDRILTGDYWFVQFGTNDSHKTATFTVDGVTYQRYADPNTDFKDHLYDYYIVPARQKNAIPVLVTPPPRNSAYCGNGNSLGGYAQAMRELADAEDVLLLDLNQRTFDHLAATCPAPTPEDFFFLRANNSVDGTHFQENGARQMAGFLGDEMIDQSAGPYQYLIP